MRWQNLRRLRHRLTFLKQNPVPRSPIENPVPGGAEVASIKSFQQELIAQSFVVHTRRCRDALNKTCVTSNSLQMSGKRSSFLLCAPRSALMTIQPPSALSSGIHTLSGVPRLNLLKRCATSASAPYSCNESQICRSTTRWLRHSSKKKRSGCVTQRMAKGNQRTPLQVRLVQALPHRLLPRMLGFPRTRRHHTGFEPYIRRIQRTVRQTESGGP